MDKREVGANIKRICDMRGISQAELARRIGKTPPMVSNYVNGKHIPPLEVIEQIADALQVDLKDIISSPVMTGGIDHFQLQRMTRAMRKLSLSGQREAVRRIEELAEIPRYRKERGGCEVQESA